MMQTVPRNDLLLIMGDFSARVGSEDAFCGTVGQHSLYRVTSQNG